jgi:hypothetical protein
MGFKVTLSDWLIVAATALSPLIAIQVSVYLARRKEAHERKLFIFKTLMATRAQSLSPLHVEALNRIDLEFSSSVKWEKAVLNLWAQLLDHLSDSTLEHKAWSDRRLGLLVDLLEAMGTGLGYAFNKTQIKNGIYSPVAHSRLEQEQEQVRKLVLELLGGSRNLGMEVRSWPPAPNSGDTVGTT